MRKPKQLIDVVEITSNIHKGDFSSLHGKSFVICDSMKKKKRRGKPVNKSNNGRMTLAKLTVTVNDLTTIVNGLTVTVNDLAKEMRDGFNRIETRLNHIEKRLDYNNLKKLPNNY